ncbi:MAG: histidine kinase [Betaproteobacteria bacterium]|nr:histidine kinase [Betaproteobacteria bacterium]
MADWLAATWEASWRPFQYFNLYRLIVAGIVLLAAVLPDGWVASLFHLSSSPRFLMATLAYMGMVGAGLFASTYWRVRFNMQLSLQVMLDATAIGVLMYAGAGAGTGVGALMLVSLATASMVGRGRLVLFYAALATVSTLLAQVAAVIVRGFEPATIVQAGFLCAGFFATAILARLLGQRIMANEELARLRGVHLENQRLISQSVSERMQDGVIVVSRDGLLQTCNPVAREMLDLPPAPAGNLADVAPLLAASLADWSGREDAAGADLSLPSGVHLRARFARTASSDGEVLVFLEDIGRIQERARELKLAALGRLTGSIAHEIRNPLSAISHAGELLHEERRGAMQDRLLQILADNVARLDRIVGDILELGRRDRIQPENLALLRVCWQFVENFATGRGLAPGAIEVAGDAGAVLAFDRNHLDQILWNLVDNAWRHSRGEPGSVRLVVRGDTDRGIVELHVIDDGSGVPESALAQIFEPFFTTHHSGTGLGLFIARELCEANGATLELDSAAGGGHFVISGRSDPCKLPEANGAPAVN